MEKINAERERKQRLPKQMMDLLSERATEADKVLPMAPGRPPGLTFPRNYSARLFVPLCLRALAHPRHGSGPSHRIHCRTPAPESPNRAPQTAMHSPCCCRHKGARRALCPRSRVVIRVVTGKLSY